MVSRFTIPALAALAVLTASPAVHAADMPMPAPIAVPETTGWYLRGDIGFSNQEVGSLFNENYAGYDSVQNIYKNFDASPFFGLGVGYSVNNWLRVDVTGEYRSSATFHGYDLGTSGGAPFPDIYNGSKSEWTFLLNGYVDLGTWSHITPFIGAGVGTSRNTISNFTDVSNCVGGCGNPGANYYSATASQWNFAWALYAGLGYQLTRNVTVELAYRYLDLGKASTGTMVSFDAATSGLTSTPFEFRHLTSQDLKLGVRFNLDSFYETPHPYYPPPLSSRG